MVTQIITFLAAWVKGVLAAWGYLGVVAMMAIESACIPLPSEVIMPAAGVLVAQGTFNFHLAALAGGLGNLLGSLVAYYVGVYGGRPFLDKYGRYVLITNHDLELADRFFARFGNMAVFIGRLLPVVRTFISLPAGIARMPVLTFSAYSFAGAWIFSYALLYVGVKLGENLEPMRQIMHKFDLVIGIVLLGGIVWYVWRHVGLLRKEAAAT